MNKNIIIAIALAFCGVQTSAETVVTPVDWLHGWVESTTFSSTVTIPSAGNVVQIPGAKWNSQDVYVDAGGQVYSGRPTTPWTVLSEPKASNGTFISVAGGVIKARPGSKIFYKNVNGLPHVFFEHFGFASNDNPNIWLNIQIVQGPNPDPDDPSSYSMFLNYQVGTFDGTKPDVSNLPEFMGFYYNQVEKKNFPTPAITILGALSGTDLLIVADGKVLDDQIDYFAGFKPYGITGIALGQSPAKFQISVDPSSAGLSQIQPGGKWVKSSLGKWGEYSGFRAKYSTSENYNAWRIWFFEEGGDNADEIGIPKLKASPTVEQWVRKSMAEFGIAGRDYKNADVVGLKVMRDEWNRPVTADEKLILDTVILEKNQPSSYNIQFVNKVVAPGYPLTVRVIGHGTDSTNIQLISPDGKGHPQFPPAGLDSVKYLGFNGSNLVTPSRYGYTYEPREYNWVAGVSPDHIIFQQYDGVAVFNPHPMTDVVMLEREVKSVDLNQRATDNINQLPLNWALDSVKGDPIPYRLDAVTGTLVVGASSSSQNGLAKFYLRATTRTGAPAHDTLFVRVTPINDPPTILASSWGIGAGALLDVNLDSTVNSQGVWVRDPDDGLLNLNWTATVDPSAPSGTAVALQGHRLKFQAPSNFQGDIVLHLAVTDPSGASTKKDVRVRVAPSIVSLFGFQTSQTTSGDLEIHFYSRFSLEAVALQNGTVSVQNPGGSATGSVPAALDVLTAPGFKNGIWSDGEYRIRIQRNANWTSGTLVRQLPQILLGQTSLSMKLPLAAGGQILTQSVVFDPIDFRGPTAKVSLDVVYAPTDEKLRTPGLQVNWSWIGTEGVADRVVVTRIDDPSIPAVVVQIPAGQKSALLAGLQDSRTYNVALEGHDQNSNPGGGSQTITTPSGVYQIGIQLPSSDLPDVTGTICSKDDALVSNCQEIQVPGYSLHEFKGLRNGLYSFTIDDPRWMGAGISLPVTVDHSDRELSWQLVPKSVLVAGKTSIEQEITTGDLVVKLGVKAPFENERVDVFTLDWLTLDSKGKALTHSVNLPVTASGFSSDGATWTLRWKTSELPAAALAADQLGNLDRKSISSIGVTTRLSTNPVGALLRNDVLQVGIAGKPTAWQVLSFAQPAAADGEGKSIDNVGRTTWKMNFGTVHGAVPQFRICRQEASGKPTCSDTVLGMEGELLRFRPTSLSAFSVPNRRNFEEVVTGSKMQVPAGADSAASQWRVFARTAGAYEVWVDWSSPKTFQTIGISVDSGSTWPIRGSYYFEGWADLGSVQLKAGWNSIAVFGAAGLSFDAVALQPKGVTFEKPVFSTLPVQDAALKGILTDSLTIDRAYQDTITNTDAFGFKWVEVDDFRVRPDGLFGDILLNQEDGTGDLILSAGETRISTTPGALTVRLAPGIPAIAPSRIDSVAGSGKLQIRLARKDLPQAFLSNTALAKSASLDSIRLITSLPVTYTWTERKCRLWGMFCHSEVHSRTSDKTDSVCVPWTGFPAWHSVHDLRPLPTPTIEASYVGFDSLVLSVKGLDGATGSRGTAATTLTASWTPGSQCAPKTTVKLPVRQVFATTADGSFEFSPLLSSAAWSTVGAWTDSSDTTPRVRHQWLDVQQGGGFFPRQILPAPVNPAPVISFAIRGTMANPVPNMNLWVLPGEFSGLSRKAFQFRLVPVGTAATDVSFRWFDGQAYPAESGPTWVVQPAALVVNPDVQELQIRMVDAGFHALGFALRPAGAAAPTSMVASLPTIGEGINEFKFSAASLSPGTLHSFTVQAEDRWGNKSDATVSVATLQPASKFPGLKISLSPWDGSGWVSGATATATIKTDGSVAIPTGSVAKARLVKRSGATGLYVDQGIDVPVTGADGTWSATLTGLGQYLQTAEQFAAGDRVVLESWLELPGVTGRRTALDFAVRNAPKPNLVTTTIADGPTGSALTFHVRRAWVEATGTNSSQMFADLDLPAFRIAEDDTATDTLVIRGAAITISAGGTPQLTSVRNGRLAAQHCRVESGVTKECFDLPRMPWTLGRWKGWLSLEGMSIQNGSLRVEQLEVMDDADRPVRNQDPVLLTDAGLSTSLKATKDRFWVRNVIKSVEAVDAFGLEACQTVITKTASGLNLELHGCKPEVGPFLTFPLQMQTDGAWSVIGSAFDSLPGKYNLGWAPTPNGTVKKWISGLPADRGGLVPDPVSQSVTQSALRGVSGASQWTYDVKSYTFSSTGIQNLVFDLSFPVNGVTPAVDSKPQQVKTFTGATITSTAAVMNGAPVLSGTATSTDPVVLHLGQTLTLKNVASWTYSYAAGTGWGLLPNPESNKKLELVGPNHDYWRFTKIGSTDFATTSTEFNFPMTKLLLGPGMYLDASSIQNVTISTKGATLKSTLTVMPGETGLEISNSSTSFTLDNFFTARNGGLTAAALPVSVTDPSLILTGEFQLADIDGAGHLDNPQNTEVQVGGFPIVAAWPTSNFQIMANRGRVVVRVLRPQGVLTFKSESSEAGTQFQSAVFTTDRMPVAVGAELPVPNSWHNLAIGTLANLNLDHLFLEASTNVATSSSTPQANLKLTGTTIVTMGSMFGSIGLEGYRLPLKSVGLGLTLPLTRNMSDLEWDIDFETAPIGFAMDLSLTEKRIKSFFGTGAYDQATDQGPAIVKFSTQGWPISAKYKAKRLDLELKQWEIELTKDFPISGLQNTTFHLDRLAAHYDDKGPHFDAFEGSGEKTFPNGLGISGVVMLQGREGGDPAKVKLTNAEGSKGAAKFIITASQIKIKDDTYDLYSCPSNGTVPVAPSSATISVGLDGAFESNVCFKVAKKLNIYPFTGDDPDVYFDGTVKDKPLWFGFKIKDGVFTFDLIDAPLKSKPYAPVLPNGLDAKIDLAELVIDEDHIALRKLKVEIYLKDSKDATKDWSQEFKPFKLTVPKITFDYNTDVSGVFSLAFSPNLSITTGDDCSGNGAGNIKFAAPIKSPEKVHFDWNIQDANFNCSIAGLKVDVEGVSVTTAQVGGLNIQSKLVQVIVPGKPSKLIPADGGSAEADATAGTGEATDPSAVPVEPQGTFEPATAAKVEDGAKGLRIRGLGWVEGKFVIGSVIPIGFKGLKKLPLHVPGIGIEAKADMKVESLFGPNPGLGFENIVVKLPKSMGSLEIPTNMGVVFNGKFPFVHPHGPKNGFDLPIPSIQLTDDIKFDGARMQVRFHQGLGPDDAVAGATGPAKASHGWSFIGEAGLSLPGAVSNMKAELAVEEPGDCAIGVCQAILTVKLANGARYPIGTTGLYISGMKGGFYDGYFEPKCAFDCTHEKMGKGMKAELAVFIEAQNPKLANGSAGMWVQLNRINFGVNAKLTVLGVADGDACAAIFRGGKQFHGEVHILLQQALSIRGGFIMDIWQDDRGGNLTAEASAEVGLGRGAIIRSRWFKYPRSTTWFGPLVARMGRFQDGSNGFTSGVRALGKTWGVGYVNGGFRLGNVGQYKLAKPQTGGALLSSISALGYRLVPLGFPLEGGEVISVNVGAADGVDWNGAQMHLVEEIKTTDASVFPPATTLRGKGEMTIPFETEDPASSVREDSMNIHSLTWRNDNRGNASRLMVAIPSTTTSSDGSAVSVASNSDDLNVFIGLLDPTFKLTAKPCDVTGVNKGSICISGDVLNFMKSPRVIKRSYSLEEQKFSNVDGSQVEVLNQKHRMQFWAVSTLPVTGSDTLVRDSIIPVEIPDAELEFGTGQSCIQPVSGTRNVHLTNCVWKPTSWPTGNYKLMAGASVEDYLGKSVNEAPEVVFLDSTRRAVLADDGKSDFATDITNPQALPNVAGLAVFTSGLTATDANGPDETKSVLVRWQTPNHPDVIAHELTWTDAENMEHRFVTGPNGDWSFDLTGDWGFQVRPPEDSIANITVASVPGLSWMQKPPTKIKVVPVTRVLNAKRDSLIWTTHPDLAATWTGTITVGQPTPGLTSNTLTASLVSLPPAAATTPVTTPILLPQDGNVQAGVKVDAGSFSSGTTPLRDASDYARADLSWIGADGNVLDSASLLKMPRAYLGAGAWRIGAASQTFEISLSGRATAQLCDTSLTHDSTCQLGDVLMPATELGAKSLRVRLWNQGRLVPGAQTTFTIPVTVTPPVAQIDRVNPDYLLGGRTQDLSITASHLWAQGGLNPVLQVRKLDGTVLAIGPNGESQIELWAHPDGSQIDTTIRLILPKLLNSDKQLRLVIANRNGLQNFGAEDTLRGVPNANDIACKREALLSTEQNTDLAMDWIGFYPKDQVFVSDTLVALFSEIHNPAIVNWTFTVKQGNGATAPQYPVQVVSREAGLLRFVLPNDKLVANQPVDLSLSIRDKSAGSSCLDAEWTSTFTPLAPRTAADYPKLAVLPSFGSSSDGYGLSDADQKKPIIIVDPPKLRKAERIEWVRGTPRSGSVWNWRSGIPTLADFPQTDSLHVRIRHKDLGVVWEGHYLVVTKPRILQLSGANRVLKSLDTVPAATVITAQAYPAATRGKDGSSWLDLQCQWGNGVWSTCPAKGWPLDSVHTGITEVRAVWHVFGRGHDTLVVEPSISWKLVWRDPTKDNIVRLPLHLDGTRLAHVLSKDLDAVVLRVRKTGSQLPRWDAKAPVIRDAYGLVLPQQVDLWDPVAKRYEAWVRVPKLVANRSVDLALWLGDNSEVTRPWGTDSAVHAGTSTASGVIGTVLALAKTRTSVPVPSSDKNGWSASLWARWSRAQRDTLWSSPELRWGFDTSGRIWADYRGDTLRSPVGALDSLGPVLAGVNWEKTSGSWSLWLNGQKVATRQTDPGDDRLVESGTATVGGQKDLDEWRWGSSQDDALWKLRWESERPRSALWDLWNGGNPVSPKAKEFAGRVGDTTSLVTGMPLWADREITITAPTTWAGASWLPGLAWSKSDTSKLVGLLTAQPNARVCAAGDSLWNPGAGWKANGNLPTEIGNRSVWCREMPDAGIRLSGPSVGTPVSKTALSWFVLPSALGSSTPVNPGDDLCGLVLPTELPDVLKGSSPVQTITGDDGRVKIVSMPGTLMIFDTLASPALGVAGSLVLDTLWLKDAQGAARRYLLIQLPGNQVPEGLECRALRTNSSVVQPLEPSATLVAWNKGDTISLPNGDRGTWFLDPVVTPNNCSDRQFQVRYRRPAQLWLALPPTAQTAGLDGWSYSGTKIWSGKTWSLWTRLADAGLFRWDASDVFPEGTCAAFVLSAVERVLPAPDWTLASLRLRGLGGARELRGGQLVMRNLDLQFAAALAMRSQQYSMRLGSISGFGENLRGVAMGLGDSRVVARADSLTGLPEYISVSSGMFLQDLRADRLDADSVHVDVRSLVSNGKVRVTVHQYGSSTFNGAMRVVLFRDRDGDLRYTPADQMLGVQALATVESGKDATLDFPIQNLSRLYPEEIFVAWLDADAVSTEKHVGDHVVQGGNPCVERKALAWSGNAPDSVLRPVTPNGELPTGAPTLGAHLRDTDHDGMVRGADSLDHLWYYGGKVCAAIAGQAPTWCKATSSVGGNSDLSVRDVDGNGVPEILAGRQVLRQDGTLLYDLDHPPANTMLLDLDEDGLLDTLRTQGTCTQVVSSTGSVLWATSGCAVGGLYSNVASIARHPLGCADISVSKVSMQTQGVSVRVANAGTFDLPVGIPVRIVGAEGAETARVVSSVPLVSGQWIDVWIPVVAKQGDRIEVPVQSLRDAGYLELQTGNNSRPAFDPQGATP